jgi:F0F1-type ATP synthase assembly protein I
MGVGLQLGATIALAALAGHWLDKRLGTSPWLLIALVFLGAAAGFYSVYRRVIGGGKR